MLYVGIDLGTYLCRFILAEHKHGNGCKTIEDRFNVLSYTTSVVNFGTMEPGKTIERATIYRIERVFDKFKKYIEEYKKMPEYKHEAMSIRCVATAALRYSPKAQELIDKIDRKFGIQIEVISSQQEIYLAALGCQDQVKDHALVLDIGSGSTEIAYIKRKDGMIEIVDYISLDLGLINNGAAKQKRNQTLVMLEEFIKKYRHLPVICSKCNTLKIAYNYFHRKRDGWVDGKRFNFADLSKVLQVFNKMDVEELKKVPSVGMKKTRLIKCGLPWVHTMIKQLGVDHITLSEYGLKEGIVLDMINGYQAVDLSLVAKQDAKIEAKKPSHARRAKIHKVHRYKKPVRHTNDVVHELDNSQIDVPTEQKHINRSSKKHGKHRISKHRKEAVQAGKKVPGKRNAQKNVKEKEVANKPFKRSFKRKSVPKLKEADQK